MRWKRQALGIAGSLCLAAATPSQAQDGYAEFVAAVEREKQADAAFDRSQERAAQFESAAAESASLDLTDRQRQSARLSQVETEIAALVDRYVYAGQRSPLLERELEILQHWYSNYSRVAQNLTPRSFLGLEAELGGLAHAGLISPGQRSFARLNDVRSAIQDVNKRLGDQRSMNAAARNRLAADIDRLERERDALLMQLATENVSNTASVTEWMDASLAAGRDASALFAAQDAVIAAYQRYAEQALRQRPPAVVNFAVTQGGGQVYRAGWVSSAGGDGSEAERRRQRDEMATLRQKVIDALDFVRSERRELAKARLDLAERMMPRSRQLEASAERYRRLRLTAAYGELALDIGLSAAEIALTGGTATLARKTEQLAQKAAERSLARNTARSLLEAATPAERAVIRNASRAGEPLSDVLRVAARRGEEILREKAPQLEQYLVSRGMPREQAARQVEQIVTGTVERLSRMNQIYQFGNRGAAEVVAAERALAGMGMQLPTYRAGFDAEILWKMLREELQTKLAGNFLDVAGKARELVMSDNREPGEGIALAVREIDTMRDARTGELIELGFTMVYNGITTEASRGLTGVAKYASKFGRGVQANAANLGIGAVSSLIEVAAAGQFDRLVNAEAKEFVRIMSELDSLYQVYTWHLQIDRVLAAQGGSLSGALAGLDQQIANLDGGYTAAPKVSSAGKAEGTLGLEVTFSSPLINPPVVRVGSTAVPMRKSGRDGRVWAGSVSAQVLGAGTHRVEITIDRSASPHGALDSDPGTPARWSFAQRGWTGFEAGPDRSHSILLDPPPIRIVANEACPSRMPGDRESIACRCPAPDTGGAVWGTYYYTDDSVLCRAARHAGVVPAGGGAILARAAAGRGYYVGSTQNGVESSNYHNWRRSVVFDGAQSEEARLADYVPCPGTFNEETLGPTSGVCRCLPPIGGAVWGSNPYTADSNICRAARHAGIVTETGGLVRVRVAPGQDSYAGSTRNEVTTSDWGSYGRSIVVSPAS